MTISHSQTFIPISEAVRKYGVSLNALLERIKSGKISAAKLPDGEYLVAEKEIDYSLTIKREDFKHLSEQTIGIAEASRKYSISHPTIIRWTKLGYIRRVGKSGQKVLLDASDVAYCAAIYHAKNGGQGKRIFDKNGAPYQAKAI